jgi:hypothetical protein
MIRHALVALALIACGKSDPKPADPPPSADKPAGASADKPVEKPAEKPAEPVHDATCEAMRDKYLAWTATRVEGALKGMPADQMKPLQAEADKEATMAREKFVGACVAMGAALDGTCFDKDNTLHHDRVKYQRCQHVVGQLEAKMFGH